MIASSSVVMSSLSSYNDPCLLSQSSEPGRAASHDLALTDQFSVELGPVKSEVDIKVNAVKGSLRGIHALKVLFEVLPAEIGSEGDDLLYSCIEWSA